MLHCHHQHQNDVTAESIVKSPLDKSISVPSIVMLSTVTPPSASNIPVVVKFPLTVKAPDVSLLAVIDKGKVIQALFAEFLNFKTLAEYQSTIHKQMIDGSDEPELLDAMASKALLNLP